MSGQNKIWKKLFHFRPKWGNGDLRPWRNISIKNLVIDWYNLFDILHSYCVPEVGPLKDDLLWNIFQESTSWYGGFGNSEDRQSWGTQSFCIFGHLKYRWNCRLQWRHFSHDSHEMKTIIPCVKGKLGKLQYWGIWGFMRTLVQFY